MGVIGILGSSGVNGSTGAPVADRVQVLQNTVLMERAFKTGIPLAAAFWE